MANHQRLFALPLVRIAFDDTRTSVSANIKSKIKKWQQNTETSMGKVNQEIERLNNRNADEFNKIRAEMDKHINILTTKVEDIGRKKADNVVEFRDIVLIATD